MPAEYAAPATLNSVQAYWTDAFQRSVLFLDILRQRGNAYRERVAQDVPNVLNFKAHLIRDGRTLPRPVNYVLVSIEPPEGVVIDPAKPPFIVVDPRAGHGPGIGGMKAESEIGEALAGGHPCYFIGFFPEPVPGQTVEDVCLAEAQFVEDVIARHPEAEGKPIVVANCQAGWQIMMMAAMRPNLLGPIMLAGSPLSYWAGVHGKNPMRYTGGVLGGSWLTSLAGDLGNGVFDGAHLVANFESLDLANTYWDKPYNVYSKVDSEGPRFLDFEEWWGSPVLLEAQEMEWIVNNLFIGDRLATGGLHMADGVRLDLRNIRSPIVIFCSWGDNITPPQQALGWITDLYEDEEEIAENGQTIVYTLHQTVGHLGIFVSGKVASKEHREFVACMDMIDLLPPGLYEAVITEVDNAAQHKDLINGRYLFSIEHRTLDDIRALGANSDEDNECFAATARVSDVNCGLYDTFLRNAVTSAVTPETAEWMRRMHPNRLRFGMFSDQNPFMHIIETASKSVRRNRQPVSEDNPLLKIERANAERIRSWLQTCGDARDAMTEMLFLHTYGSPFLQAWLGLGRAGEERRPEKDVLREAIREKRHALLEARIARGGPLEATVRSLIYVVGAEGTDERRFAMLQALRTSIPQSSRMPLSELKTLLADESLLMRRFGERAVAALPALLPADPSQRDAMLEAIHALASVRGELPDEAKARFDRIVAIFHAEPEEMTIGPPHARRQPSQTEQRPHA